MAAANQQGGADNISRKSETGELFVSLLISSPKSTGTQDINIYITTSCRKNSFGRSTHVKTVNTLHLKEQLHGSDQDVLLVRYTFNLGVSRTLEVGVDVSVFRKLGEKKY